MNGTKNTTTNSLINTLRKSKILVVTHFYATGGQPTDLFEWLQDKAGELVFIAHPFSYAKDTRSWLEHWIKGKLVEKRYYKDWAGRSDLSFWRKDVRLTREWVRGFLPPSPKALERGFDLAIAADALNVHALRPFHGRGIEKLVFYTIDYVPQRFKNPVLNAVYHWFDNKAVSSSDQTWNLTSRMQKARERRGMSEYTQRTIAGGLFLRGEKPLAKRSLTVAFMGHMREGQGVEALVEAFPAIRSAVPKAKLLLLGGGPLEEKIRERVKKLGLTKSVEITGYVKEHKDLERRLRECALAVAPYDGKSDFTYYADPGKPKVYLAAGLPVVITRIPEIADVIEKHAAGVALNQDEDLVPTIIHLLQNPQRLQKMQKNAFALAQSYDWDVIFPKALAPLLR